MTRRMIVRPSARRDVIEQIKYIDEDSPEAAERYADATESAFADLADMPGLGRVFELVSNPRLPGLRQYGVPGFRNYIIFYLSRQDAVEIVRVLHGTRNIGAILEDEREA